MSAVALALRVPRARALASVRAGHVPGVALQLVLALWLWRRALFSSALPAGTDMLGFIGRARENARGDAWLSVWSPTALGAPRQFTLESVLGLATKVTGDPAVTVKLVAIGVFAAAGCLAYWLAADWLGDRRAAALAGVLYMTSQASLSQSASGHLNVTIMVALAPLVVLLWGRCLDGAGARAALPLALVVSVLLVARIDMTLYLAPFLALQVLVFGRMRRGLRPALGRAVRAAALIVPAVVATNLYQLLPYLHGIRASWMSSGSLFHLEDFTARSLDAFPSLVGFGREIGYLAFTGRQTWYSHPFLPLGLYFALAAALVALACATVLWRRDERVVFLLAAAALAAFMGKGFHPPAGGAYLWAAEHVPVFRNLRDPNRWLIVTALGYAVLAPVTLLALGRRLPRGARPAAAAVVLAALLAPNAPTLLSGFAVWRPGDGEAELLVRAATGPASAPVATIPYDQTRRFLRDGAYRGWEHDLGAQSVAFTGRAALGDGSWNQRVADCVAYTGSLLAGGDRAFTSLVGALGVRDLVAFDERPTAPHLVRPGDPLYQQHAIARMLRPAARTSGGAAYRLPAAGVISFRPNVAVVLGGLSGLSAMAHLHGLHLDRWAALGASDVVAQRGLAGLLAQVRRADMVVVADERPEDLGVVAAPALARTAGMTSDPALDLETQTVPSDATARLGALAAPGAVPAASGVRAVSAPFTAARASAGDELWLRVRSLPAPARLTVAVDGRRVGTVLPLSPAAAGLRWVRAATVSLGAGRHTLAVTAARSEFGAAYELAEARVVPGAARRRATVAITSALAAARDRAVYALDLGDAQKYVSGTAFARASDPLAPDLRRFFTALEPRRVSLTATRGEHGAVALNVSLYAGRGRYTVLQHFFARPQDWRGRGYLALRYRGSGDGAPYRVIADFTNDHRRSASFPLVDDAAGWHTRLLSLRSGSPHDTRSPWRHVVSLRLATDSKSSAGSLDLERLAVSPVVSGLTIPYTVPGLSRAAIVGAADASGRAVAVRARRTGDTVRVRAPTVHARGTRVFIAPPRLAERPAPRVRFTKESLTRYRFAVDAPHGGYLVLGQGYDARWRTGGAGAVPVLGTVDGFALGAGRHAGTIAFAGQSSAVNGAALSLAAWLALLALIGRLRVRSRRAGA